ncbi:MAG: T9SS type A sorting domain-containing protein [Flavobacteriales bacterium]|nr:T9SS type A sorting domain-containing protein [Flavobacteriales bacterium]
MKRHLTILTFLIALLPFNQISGQGLNYEAGLHDSYDQHIIEVVCVNEFTYTAFYHSGYSFSNYKIINKTDTAGNLIWSREVNPKNFESVALSQMIASEDGGLYVAGWSMAFCDVSSDCYAFVQKVSPAGKILWTKYFNDEMCSFNLITALSLNSSDLLIIGMDKDSETDIYLVDTSGTDLDSTHSTKGYIVGFESINPNRIIAYGGFTMEELDLDGNVINARIFGGYIQDAKAQNDSLYVVSADSVFILDENLNVLIGTELNGHQYFSNLKLTDGVIKMASQESTALKVLTLDKELNLLDTKTISADVSLFTKYDFSNSHLSIGDNHDLYKFQSVRFRDFSLTNPADKFTNTYDIGIVNMETYDTLITLVDTMGDVYSTSINAQVLLKNFGNVTVDNCVINHYLGQGICNASVYFKTFISLNLAPNDSVWLDLGEVDAYTNAYNWTDTIYRDICIYTANPNQYVDLMADNDVYCDRVVFGFVGIDKAEKRPVVIYPNPTQGNLYIDSNNKIDLVNVWDMTGRLVHASSKNEINLSDELRGVYIIKVTTEDKTITKKVILN